LRFLGAFGIAAAYPEVRRYLDELVELEAPRFYTKLFKRHHRKSFYRCFYERYRNPKIRALRADGWL